MSAEGEKFYPLKRVVGAVPEVRKQEVREQHREQFFDQAAHMPADLDWMEGAEQKEKTAEHLRIIELANKATNDICRRYGGEAFDLPPENVHIVDEIPGPKSFHYDIPGPSGKHVHELEGIIVQDDGLRSTLAAHTAHEMIHKKSNRAMQIRDDGTEEAVPYRGGLKVYSRKGKDATGHLHAIDEAVTERMAMEAVALMRNDPVFESERASTQGVLDHYESAVLCDWSGERFFRPPPKEEILWAEPVSSIVDRWVKTNPNRTREEQLGRFGQYDPAKVAVETHAYRDERKLLDLLCRKIHKASSKLVLPWQPKRPRTVKLSSAEEAYEMFARAKMTGNIIPVMRLVDKLWGAGTFRRLTANTVDTRDHIKAVEALRA